MGRMIGYSPYGWKPGDLGPFAKLFPRKKDITSGLEGIDCLLLWGGEDIHPSFYKEPPHKTNETQEESPSERDLLEYKALLYCKTNDIPVIGVCRGAQLLCAFNGGSLAQHVTGHQHSHMIRTIDNRGFLSTSVHHQMMNPYNIPHTLIAWAFPCRSEIYKNGWDKDIAQMHDEHEAEIVYFPGNRGLAIQGHPEYNYADFDFQNYCNDLVKQYLFEEV